MYNPSHPKISGLCWGISQINQQRFNKTGDILGNIVPKDLTHCELEKAQS